MGWQVPTIALTEREQQACWDASARITRSLHSQYVTLCRDPAHKGVVHMKYRILLRSKRRRHGPQAVSLWIVLRRGALAALWQLHGFSAPHHRVVFGVNDGGRCGVLPIVR